MAETSVRLEPCPETPNCVSTQADPSSQHYLSPIATTLNPATALDLIAEVVRATPRSEILDQDEQSLKAVFRSRMFRFPDDVHFVIDEREGLIHFRAKARYGSYDFGVNKRRMTELSKTIQARLAAEP